MTMPGFVAEFGVDPCVRDVLHRLLPLECTHRNYRRDQATRRNPGTVVPQGESCYEYELRCLLGNPLACLEAIACDAVM
jgi:hypothetical protein